MGKVRVITDLNACKDVWEEVVPQNTIWDLWDVRNCFHKHYQRPPCFIVAEKNGRPQGLLPLSWIKEVEAYGYFPGETCDGKTWLEQNRILGAEEGSWLNLLKYCPGSYSLRYLVPPGDTPQNEFVIDEIGYLFFPSRYEYSIEKYFGEFSRKSRKRLQRELGAFEKLGLSYRFNDPDDFEHLVNQNRERFGRESYFSDDRFTKSLRNLMELLKERGWLRITTVLIDGKIAAVDLGCIYNGVYTLLGGGTDRDFPGIAKVINIHHIRLACELKLRMVDFLCGDFSWKTIFHLQPRPLYLLAGHSSSALRTISGRPERPEHAN